MFKPVKMEKFSLLGLLEDEEKIVSYLYDRGDIQIEDFFRRGKNAELQRAGSLEKSRQIADALERIRTVCASLSPGKKISKKHQHLPTPQLVSEANQLCDKTQQSLQNMQKKLDELSEREKELSGFLKLSETLSEEKGSLGKTFAGKIPTSHIEQLKTPLAKYLPLYDFKQTKFSPIESMIMLSVDEKDADVAKDMLYENRFKSLVEPGEEKNLQQIIQNMLEEIEKNRQQLLAEKQKISEKDWENAYALKEMLEIEHMKAEVPVRFGKTEKTFVLEAWVPQKKSAGLKKDLEKMTKGKMSLSILEETNHEYPIELDNPQLAKPFEFFVKLLALPKYAEYDPTVLFLLTFPLFYGFILGDAGYGIIILAVALFMKKKYKQGDLSAIASVLVFSAISGIIFGILYGEFFGTLGHEYLHLKPIWMDRVEAIQPLLIVTIAMGITHLTLAFAIGAWQRYELGHMKHAVEKVSWIFLIIGGVFLALSLAGTAEIPLYLSLSLILLAVFGIGYGGGAAALIEVPNLLGNVFSYARLLALGLASVGLAMAINILAEKALQVPYGAGIILALLIGVLGHTVNILLGVVEPGIQSMRLHYVEFLGKFYEGGGRAYQPFRHIRTYTHAS